MASAALIATGAGLAAPANAAPSYTVNITILQNGVAATNGHFFAYDFDPVAKYWSSTDSAYTNGAGQASLTLDSATPYRFCYHSDVSDEFEELCFGGDTIDQATTVNLTGNLNLGTINLAKKSVLNLSGITIQGRAVVGQRLSVNLNTLPAGVTESGVTWYLDGMLGGPGGTDILGQQLSSGSSYVVRNSDLGHTITAYVGADGPRIAAPDNFFGGKPYLTPATATIVLPMGFSSAPMIKAPKWKKGKTVTYVAPAITPPGATTTYQWLRNGAPIKGATGSTYKLKRKDKKKKISVKATYTYSGYETTTMESTPSPKIK